MNESSHGIDDDTLLNGERINDIKYADNAVIFADSFQDLQELMSNIEMISQRYGLEQSIRETKSLPPEPLIINLQSIEGVTSVAYLGTSIND